LFITFDSQSLSFRSKSKNQDLAPPLGRWEVDFRSLFRNGGRPFLTDTGCLYFSGRANAREHLLVAAEHGFSPRTTLAPVLIADGLRESDVTPVEEMPGPAP